MIVTDGFRTEESNRQTKNASPTSLHKEGKALDIRIDDSSKNLLKLSKEELYTKYNIKSASIHNDNHVHIEFN